MNLSTITADLPSLEPETRLLNPVERPQITQALSENVILTSVDDLYNLARLSSLWSLMFGTACCFIEFASFLSSRVASKLEVK